jgi:hypothetical protein
MKKKERVVITLHVFLTSTIFEGDWLASLPSVGVVAQYFLYIEMGES